MKKKQLCSLFMSLAICITSFTCITASSDLNVEAASTGSQIASNASSNQLEANIQDGVTLQCFNWSFRNIQNNMQSIASQGFSAIQTSPIQPIKESSTNRSEGSCWWLYYQPTNFCINTDSNSALGTKEDFIAMCEEAHRYGVKVIVDIVANHLANRGDNTISAANNPDIRDDMNCWHDIHVNTANYSDRYDVTQHCMGGLPDLNTANPKIQNYVLNFMKECIDSGADGFRFDGAKHIETPDDYGFSSNFWPYTIQNATRYAKDSRGIDLYCYGEILDAPGNNFSIRSYSKYISVTDNRTSNTVRNAIVNKDPVRAASSYYYNQDASAKKIVLWNESHDTYSNKESNWVSTEDINKTWALIAARADAMGFYLARPYDFNTKLGDAADTGWSYPVVQACNRFHNTFTNEPEYCSSTDQIAYIERGTSGIVLVNCKGTSTNVDVSTHCISDGTYTDLITQNTFTVNNGHIRGNIGDTGIAVVCKATSAAPEPKDDPIDSTGSNKAFLKLPDGWSDNVFCYAYDSATEKITNGAWPGVRMQNEGNGLYSYEVPADIKAPRVIFYSSDSARYPAAMEPGLLLNGTMIYDRSLWENYTPAEAQSGTIIADPLAQTGNNAYFSRPDDWNDTIYCYVYSADDESICNAKWPGIPMTKDADGSYYYHVDDHIKSPLVLFTDGNRQVPGANQPGLSLSGSMLYQNGNWLPK